MANLRQFLAEEKKQGKTIYPPAPEYFNALNTTPLSQVKVVILGQDPYHGVGQAHGLCFSVRRGIAYSAFICIMFIEN
jgi:uracil-DNA glycosylase